ncbi:MAG: TetR family transcriptional regulator [Planctomycetes bacterium]|nr:TetR family transcriptional regulator [Planctomycetota bacterium]
MSSPSTRTAILDAAERLFGDIGYAATSMRQLTSRAKVNLAAVNYHFGSKAALAKAVLARAIAPINEERLRRLDALPVRADVRSIVRAFVEPPLRGVDPEGNCSAERVCRVFGRISVEQPPFLETFLRQQFREVGGRFEAALAAALPRLSATTIWWRLHFLVGAMAHTLRNGRTLAALTDGRCDPSDIDALLEHVVSFAVGGFAAQAPLPARTRRSAAPRRGVARSKEIPA